MSDSDTALRQAHRSGSGAGADGAVAVWARDLAASYGGSAVLSDVNLALPRGELTALVGPNGAGKSTFFKLLSGIMKPLRGEVRVLGEPVGVQRRNSLVAYVPQEEQIDWDFPISVANVVLAGRFGRMRAAGWRRRFLPAFLAGADHWRTVHDALNAVEMDYLADRAIGALSGGQKKRVFLARAIAQQAEILLLDEPLAGVDGRSAKLIFSVLRRLRSAGRTVLLVTHDLSSAEDYADRMILLNRQVIDQGRPRSVLTPENLARTFEGGFVPRRFSADDEKGAGQ